MEFETAAQEETAGRVRAYLAEAFGEHVEEAPSDPAWYVPLGRVGARIAVSPIGDEDSVVDVDAWLARGLEVTDEVARYLVARNALLRFCALSVDADGDILLEASLFGDLLTPEALARIVEHVAITAEEVEAELRERFG